MSKKKRWTLEDVIAAQERSGSKGVDALIPKAYNVKMPLRINIKPMSVNVAWEGRRFKTPEYLAYEKSAISIMPPIELPKPPYRLNLTFGFSSKLADLDNPVKLIQDILQKRYAFNDRDIHESFCKKVLVPKRQEYFEFELIHIAI